jgi:hypothetical protein
MIFRVEYFVVRDLPQKRARQLAFEALLMSFERNKRYRLVIENDENHTQWDRRVISHAIAELGLSGFVSFEHDNARSQVLLWLPDALAWTKARGGEWAQNLSQFDCKTTEVN